jgi:hypothetical protein
MCAVIRQFAKAYDWLPLVGSSRHKSNNNKGANNNIISADGMHFFIAVFDWNAKVHMKRRTQNY